jgi:hypothetical protein
LLPELSQLNECEKKNKKKLIYLFYVVKAPEPIVA